MIQPPCKCGHAERDHDGRCQHRYCRCAFYDTTPAPNLSIEDSHCIALARELTYAADCPLRDRFGFAARDRDVLFVLDAVFREPDNVKAGYAIGLGNFGNDIEIAEHGMLASEEYEQQIVRALRPLIEQRRGARERSLR